MAAPFARFASTVAQGLPSVIRAAPERSRGFSRRPRAAARERRTGRLVAARGKTNGPPGGGPFGPRVERCVLPRRDCPRRALLRRLAEEAEPDLLVAERSAHRQDREADPAEQQRDADDDPEERHLLRQIAGVERS